MYHHIHHTQKNISIHAPSRERPPAIEPKTSPRIISIHAPSRERHRRSDLKSKPKNFNPRSLAGATSLHIFVTIADEFQSTLPRGSDRQLLISNTDFVLFQSTLPRGSDSLRNNIHVNTINFNPRSLAGATKNECFTYFSIGISIHAPSRERHWLIWNEWFRDEFQSTLPRGSDNRQAQVAEKMSDISIHAPSRERPNTFQIKLNI